jgi:tight adherence protein B
MSSILIILLLSAIILITSTSVFLIYGSPEERRMEARIKRLTDPKSVSTGTKGNSPNLAASKGTSVSVSLDQKIKQLLPNADLLRLKVERAGFNVNLSVVFIIIGALCGLFVMFFATVLALPMTVSISAGIALGLAAPTMIISMRGKKRIKEFNSSLPDAIDLIVRNVRSGLPVSEGINSVSTDLTGPISEEFKTISDQITIGVPMEDALARSVKRVAAPDFAFLSIALAIQKETGGNLTEALGNLSRLLRQRNQMQLKVRALTSEARSSAMIIGALPFLVIMVLVVMNPDYVSVLIEDETGQTVSMVGLASMLLGYTIMAKMVRFQI